MLAIDEPVIISEYYINLLTTFKTIRIDLTLSYDFRFSSFSLFVIFKLEVPNY